MVEEGDPRFGARFGPFLASYPPEIDVKPCDAHAFANAISMEFGVRVPDHLVALWGEVGVGRFRAGALTFLGPEDDGLVAWNREPFWRRIYPPPGNGGPLFVGETCFGDQIGFRVDSGRTIFVLFLPDTFESFVLTDDPERLFDGVLADPEGLIDAAHLRAVRRAVGPLPPGHHYAPVLSPLLGGSRDPDNYMSLDRRAHLVAATAEWEALGHPLLT